MNKLEKFLEGSHPPNSFNAVLHIFLKKKQRKRRSKASLVRLYYSLHPISDKLNNPQISILTDEDLCLYIEEYRRDHARDSVRTVIGDVRMFSRWCKKKGYIKRNIAKYIKPIKRNKIRYGRSKAAPESEIKKLIKYLAKKLKQDDLVFRDLFDTLDVADSGWNTKNLKILRDLFITVFLYETGARGGELSKLGTKKMDKATAKRADFYIITLKGKEEERDYFFTERTTELWRIWNRVRPNKCRGYAVIGWGNGHKHERFLTNGISSMLVRRCEQAGIPPFRSHALRHAKVKRSRKKVGLEMASLLVDHSDLDTTKGYANIDEDEITEAAIKTGLQYDLWK